MRNIKKLLGLGMLAAGLASASAISIGVNGMGSWTQGNSGNEGTYLQYMIDWYNQPPVPTAPTEPGPDPVFNFAAGTLVAATMPNLPDLNGVSLKDDTDPQLTIPAGWMYLVVKSGNTSYAYYINGEGGAFANPSTQNAVSHWHVFGARPQNRVPDGGLTVAMLGAALLGLGALRRMS